MRGLGRRRLPTRRLALLPELLLPPLGRLQPRVHRPQLLLQLLVLLCELQDIAGALLDPLGSGRVNTVSTVRATRPWTGVWFRRLSLR